MCSCYCAFWWKSVRMVKFHVYYSSTIKAQERKVLFLSRVNFDWEQYYVIDILFHSIVLYCIYLNCVIYCKCNIKCNLLYKCIYFLKTIFFLIIIFYIKMFIRNINCINSYFCLLMYCFYCITVYIWSRNFSLVLFCFVLVLCPNTISWQFISILHFAKIVANMYNPICTYLYDLLKTQCLLFVKKKKKKVCSYENKNKMPPHKIKFSHKIRLCIQICYCFQPLLVNVNCNQKHVSPLTGIQK